MRFPLDNWLSLKFGLKFKQPYPAGFGSLSGKPHLGIDVTVPEGTVLYAPENGKMVARIPNATQGGNTIHYLGYTTGVLWRFMHLKVMNVVGTFVTGDILGYTGNTGVSTGPHIHIDCSKDGNLELNNINNFIDPLELLNKYLMAFEQYNEKFIRSEKGHYALVIRGKKYEMKDLDAIAILTWLQRNHLGNFENGVKEDTYNAIPDSDGLKF